MAIGGYREGSGRSKIKEGSIIPKGFKQGRTVSL